MSVSKRLDDVFRLNRVQRLLFAFLMISWLSTVILLGYSQPSYSQTKLPLPLPTITTSTCQQLQLPVSSVTASGFDSPNAPSNILDNNLKTRWSNTGLPSSVQFNLGQSRLVCSVDVAWYQGSSRAITFIISFSTDGSTFTNPQQFQNRRTNALENYDFPDINAQYVKIDVINSRSNSASITEADIYAVDDGIPPPPPPPPPGGDVDPFGIVKIYPTKEGGEEWFMNMNNPTSDPRTSPPPMTLNPPGCSPSDPCWRVTSTQVRYGVFTSSGYNPNQITTLDHSQLAQKGYMQSPNDWKNVEMTGYVKVVTDKTDTENFAWYARGGRHTGSGAPEGCEGSSIKGVE
jgi:F5/8 type C domain-containing protein